MRTTAIASFIVISLYGLGCGGGKALETWQATARTAAKAFCDCVDKAIKRPRADLAKDKDACRAEKSAFDATWKTCPTDPGDDVSQNIYDGQLSCSSALIQAQTAPE
ncbi:MAG: hypothetical protein IT373_17445 [Polyangiaceae bacterium]|nr:hypothetical protein [Polyangiaceae bacterium]